MQLGQTCSRRINKRSRVTGQVLSGMLALILVSSCDDQRSRRATQQEGTGAAGTGSTGAPVVRAPEDVRVSGEYIVVFASEVADAAVDSAADLVMQAGGENRVNYRYSVIPGFAARLDEAVLEKLRHGAGVAYIEEDQQVWLVSTFPSPADGLDRTDQREGRDGMYSDRGHTGAGVHVYVIDTGLNTQHTEYTGRVGGGYSAVADGRGVEDCHGHGSHVSSTAVGTAYGMAKQAMLHPVRVLGCDGTGSWADVIAGVDFVRNDCLKQGGPCVANMSLGGWKSDAVNAAVARAVDSGIAFVVAAGNANMDACFFSPAGESKAITVAAIDDADKRAEFSNWGACVDIFAPGVSILGAWVGGSSVSASLSGTSMASPHVVGAVAQYLSANPRATPTQVERNIKGSASLNCVEDAAGSPDVLLFNDLDQGNYTCSKEPASCRGLCGGPGDGCFCDSSCERYNDCCHDYVQVCK